MMTCEACQRSLAAQTADDALPAAVADHIAGCTDCAAVLVQERHVRSALAAAPWPSSALAGDLQRLTTFAVAHEAERRLRRQRLARRWASGIGLLAVAAWIGARVVAADSVSVGTGWLRTALPVALGVAGWAWLEVVGRRMAAAGATTVAQLGLGAGRAAIGLALVVTLVEPSRWAELPYAIARMAGGPAEAQGGVVEAELVCAAGGDGRLRLARASDGCRAHEVAVTLDGRVGGEARAAASGAAWTAGDAAFRFGTTVIRAGDSGGVIQFSPPMPDASYTVLLTPHNAVKPITVDDACHVIGIGGKSTGHFSIDIRRCWFEGIDVPHDWAASDITVDWVVIGGR